MTIFSPRLLAVLASSGLAALSAMLMQLALLLQSPLADYGLFAFLQVLQALLLGVSSALFSAPLLSRQQDSFTNATIKTGSYFVLQLLFVLGSGTLVMLIAESYDIAFNTAVWLGVAVALQLWRWFARSLLQNNVNTKSLIYSDALFSFLAIIGTVLLWAQGQISLLHLAKLNALAAASSLAMSGSSFWQQHWRMWQQRDWQLWQQGFCRQAKPALIGVVSTEAAANSHSYLITLIAGPAAFAPVAVAAMLFRPCALLLTNLAQLTRGQLQQLWLGKKPLAPLLAHFRRQSIWLWFGNSGLLLVLCGLAGDQILVWLAMNDWVTTDIYIAVLLWGGLSLLRTLRSASTIQLQVQDQFAALAHTALWPALLSVVLVFIFLQLWPAVWTIAAVILSEVWMAWLLRLAVRRSAEIP
jgi:hypothetical protein